MESLPIVKKSFRVNLDKIEEGYMYSEITCYAETHNEARTILLAEAYGLKRMYLDEDITYLNIPVMRDKSTDLVLFEGVKVSRCRVSELIKDRERIADLNKILNDPAVEFCYIRKRGTYYMPNSCGYTEYVSNAGVYTKQEAISNAKSCNELSIIPIDKESHNKMIHAKIESLKSRLI